MEIFLMHNIFYVHLINFNTSKYPDLRVCCNLQAFLHDFTSSRVCSVTAESRVRMKEKIIHEGVT